jgi:hypothetical protein
MPSPGPLDKKPNPCPRPDEHMQFENLDVSERCKVVFIFGYIMFFHYTLLGFHALRRLHLVLMARPRKM